MNSDKWSYTGKLTRYQLCCGGYEKWESKNATIVLDCPNNTVYVVSITVNHPHNISSYVFDTLSQMRKFITCAKKNLTDSDKIYEQIRGGEYDGL